MPMKITLVAVSALALTTGCNRGEAANNVAVANNTAAAAVPTAPMTAPANTAAPAPAGGAPVDQAFLIGHWGFAGNCAQTVSFNADGSATSPGEDDPVRWTLVGSTLSIIENNDAPETSTVTRSGDMLVIDPQRGDTLQLGRCPAAGTGTAGTAPTPPAR